MILDNVLLQNPFAIFMAFSFSDAWAACCHRKLEVAHDRCQDRRGIGS